MDVIKVSSNNFKKEVLESDIPVLVDFNATWCAPCRMLKEVMYELAGENPKFKIVSIDVDEESTLAKEYEVFSIPCLIAFKNGKMIKREVGFRNKSEIEEMMEGV